MLQGLPSSAIHGHRTGIVSPPYGVLGSELSLGEGKRTHHVAMGPNRRTCRCEIAVQPAHGADFWARLVGDTQSALIRDDRDETTWWIVVDATRRTRRLSRDCLLRRCPVLIAYGQSLHDFLDRQVLQECSVTVLPIPADPFERTGMHRRTVQTGTLQRAAVAMDGLIHMVLPRWLELAGSQDDAAVLFRHAPVIAPWRRELSIGLRQDLRAMCERLRVQMWTIQGDILRRQSFRRWLMMWSRHRSLTHHPGEELTTLESSGTWFQRVVRDLVHTFAGIVDRNVVDGAVWRACKQVGVEGYLPAGWQHVWDCAQDVACASAQLALWSLVGDNVDHMRESADDPVAWEAAMRESIQSPNRASSLSCCLEAPIAAVHHQVEHDAVDLFAQMIEVA